MDRLVGGEKHYALGESSGYSKGAVHGPGPTEYKLYLKLKKPIDTVQGVGLSLSFSSKRQRRNFLRDTISAGEVPGLVKINAEAYKSQLARDISEEALERVGWGEFKAFLYQFGERRRLLLESGRLVDLDSRRKGAIQQNA